MFLCAEPYTFIAKCMNWRGKTYEYEP